MPRRWPTIPHSCASPCRSLVDPDRSVIKRYGVYHRLGLSVQHRSPATFIIDRAQRIRFMYISAEVSQIGRVRDVGGRASETAPSNQRNLPLGGRSSSDPHSVSDHGGVLDFFVSSRGHDHATVSHSACYVAKDIIHTPWRFVKTSVRSSSRRPSRRLRRIPGFLGKASKTKRSVGRPATTLRNHGCRARNRDDRDPLRDGDCTRRIRSEISGLPASETRAILMPSCKRRIRQGAFVGLVVAVEASERLVDLIMMRRMRVGAYPQCDQFNLLQDA